VSKIRGAIVALIIAAATSAVAASPASAQGVPNPNENNCYGTAQSGFVAGPGGNPGTTNGEVTSGAARSRPGQVGPNTLVDFQQAAREQNASCGTTGKP